MEPLTRIRLILADDHPALIAGVRHELSAVPTLDIVGIANNSSQIVDVLDAVQCDILITDYAMPGGGYGDGIVFLSLLKRRYPDLKIIIFTALNNPAIVREMTKLGIPAVLSKVDDIGHLIAAIYAVYAGTEYRSPSANPSTTKRLITSHASADPRQLTRREVEVVRLYVSGMSVNEIASKLCRSKQTISAQKTSAMRKLGIQRVADLHRYAYENGLVVSAEPPSLES
jgi:two-component system, NarL family, captular synthesis response regulator RcsB